MPFLALLGSPLVKYALLAAAIVAAVVGFGAWQRSVGAANIKAQYEEAAREESARRTRVLEEAQARAQQAVEELEKTRRSRDEMVQQNDELARTLADRGCLDPGVVRELDRIR